MSDSLVVVNGRIGLTSSRQQLARAGKWFVATNPTPGTAIAYANKTAYSATANGLFSISNNNPAAGGASIQLGRLRLIQTATAPTGTLVARAEVLTETGIVALSGAAAAVTPVNINPASTNPTGAIVTFFSAGAGTVPAAVGTRKLVDVASLACGVSVQHDSWSFIFGEDGMMGGTSPLTAARATAPADLAVVMEPVIIPPQCSAWMNLWTLTGAANVPSFEFRLDYVEL